MMKTNLFLFGISILLISACTQRPNKQEFIQLVRKPYLQSAIADSLTILWRTESGDHARVRYKEKGTRKWRDVKGLTRITNTEVVENEVTLHQLSPNTTYEYQVFTNNIPLLSDQKLWFPSPVSSRDSVFSFFAVGDVGEPVADGGTPNLLAEALEPHIDSFRFGLLLGDIIYPDGKSEDYDKNLFQYFGNCFPYLPVFTILGNHDWHNPEDNYVKEWKLPGNEHYYSFNYGNAHFVGLDSRKGDFFEFELQTKWLREDLAKVSEEIDWIIVFLHHQGKSCTYKKDNQSVISLYPIFEEYGVDLVLNGHAHTYERLNPMNGSGEVQVASDGQFGEYKNPSGFISITAGSGGKLRGIGSDPKPFVPNPVNCQHPNLVAAFAHQWAYLSLKIEGRQLIGKAILTETQEMVDQFKIDKR